MMIYEPSQSNFDEARAVFAESAEFPDRLGIVESATDSTPINACVSQLNTTINRLGEEVDRLRSRTSTIRNSIPTDSGAETEADKELGSPLFSELVRLDRQANAILRNLQTTIGELEV